MTCKTTVTTIWPVRFFHFSSFRLKENYAFHEWTCRRRRIFLMWKILKEWVTEAFSRTIVICYRKIYWMKRRTNILFSKSILVKITKDTYQRFCLQRSNKNTFWVSFLLVNFILKLFLFQSMTKGIISSFRAVVDSKRVSREGFYGRSPRGLQ